MMASRRTVLAVAHGPDGAHAWVATLALGDRLIHRGAS